MNKILPVFLLVLGFTFIILGIVFTPDVVSKYVKQGRVLPSYTIDKVVSYQIYTIGAGCFLILISVFLLSKKYVKYIFVPLIILFFILFHNVYVNRYFPDNIFLKPSEFVKPWRVLLGKEIVLKDFQPKSALVVANKKVIRAKYPVIDFHFHLDSMEKTNTEELLKAMDACGVNSVVHLLGAPRHIDTFKKDFVDKYPGRFMIFSTFDLHEIGDSNKSESDFIKRQIALLENAKKLGAKGMKVYKSFGLRIKDKSGRLVPIDDPRYDPIWDKVGKMGMPILMHVTDPTEFFKKADRFNERYEELRDFPDWSYYGPGFPAKETLLLQAENLVKKYPQTIFVMAHMGSNSENLGYVSYLMDKYPNYYVDTAAVLPEIGRQPFTARKFFIKYQDRILFGTDGGYGLDPKGLWSPEKLYGTYFEFFETSNEYFEYPLWGTHNQGRWRIYGIDLPDEVLKKIYYKNAEKLLLKKS